MSGYHISKQDLARILQQPGYAVERDNTAPVRGKTKAHLALEKAETSKLEHKFADLWQQCGGEGEWVRNLRFDLPDSRMEFDFSMPDLKIAVEVNGGQGLGNQSGHGNWKGLERDAKKQAQAIRKGWRLFWLVTSTVNPDGIQTIIETVKEARNAHLTS